MPRRHLVAFLPFMVASLLTPTLRAATPAPAPTPAPAFDESKLIGTYAADQSPQDPALSALMSLQLRTDHTFTLRAFAKAPGAAFDRSSTGTWKLTGDTLTITLKSDDQGKPIDAQDIDFTIAQDGRILLNQKPLAVMLIKDFTSPKLPPATAPATASATAPAATTLPAATAASRPN